jgi:hypothetical protein
MLPILHPDIIERRRQIAELRHSLASAFDKRIHLDFDVVPALRHRYTELFGRLEGKMQERTLDLNQRKRMVELFALKIDRGEKLDAQMVQLVMKAVANQFGEVRGRVQRGVAQDKRRQEHGQAHMQTDAEGLTPVQHERESHRLYRRLAWRLHPDSLKDNDALSRKYWDLVQDGYHRGDLPLLRTLNQLVADVGQDYGVGVDALAMQQRKLHSALRSEERRIERITSTEPYTLRHKLEDVDWIAARRAELEKELDGIEAEITTCNDFLDPILEIAKDASPPEIANDVWTNFVETMYINSR